MNVQWSARFLSLCRPKVFCFTNQSHGCRVLRQQQVLSALAPILSEAEDGQASALRELAYLRNGHVVTALALALVFSAPDVFGGYFSDSAVAA